MRNYEIALFVFAATVFSCGKAPKHIASSTAINVDRGTSQPKPEDNGNEDAKTDAAMLTCSATDGRIYKGFGGANLTAGRETEVAKEGDRFRVKPYLALSGEYTRVFGSVPASLTTNATSFVVAPDRWYVDAEASAITLFTSYRFAYEAALTLAAKDAKFAAAPSEETATVNCMTFARQAWNRIPSNEEVAACKKVALVETASESDIKARWAYALASILASASFLSY